MRVPYGADLNDQQRMEIATATGHAERLINALRWPVDDEAVAEMHAVTRDPAVYGIALGNVLANIERRGWTHEKPLAELYRACGADEDIAARQVAWRREQKWQ